MVKKDPVIEKVTQNFTRKSVTIRPDKKNQVFTYKQIKKYSDQVLKTLPENSKVIITGLNILRETTLKGYNDPMMEEEEFEEYTKGKTKEASKFDKFFNFTISVYEPNKKPNYFK
jgi:hypothetical protein